MELLIDILLALGIAAILRGFVFTLVCVKGFSMSDTLKNGDRLFATKLDLIFAKPKRGQIVICHYPDSRRKNYIKRVIGLPGDTLEISGGVTYINGAALLEPYVSHPTRRDFAPVTLGDGEYFVMGDNRACSRDSRVVGPLGRRQIFAVARLRLWPRGGKMRL